MCFLNTGTYLNCAVVVSISFENYAFWICEVRLARESRYFCYFFCGLLVIAVLKPGAASHSKEIVFETQHINWIRSGLLN